MINRIVRRPLAIFISLALIMSSFLLVPTTTFADSVDVNSYEELLTAASNANEYKNDQPTIIRITKDINISSEFLIDKKNIYIDGNNHTITAAVKLKLQSSKVRFYNLKYDTTQASAIELTDSSFVVDNCELSTTKNTILKCKSPVDADNEICVIGNSILKSKNKCTCIIGIENDGSELHKNIISIESGTIENKNTNSEEGKNCTIKETQSGNSRSIIKINPNALIKLIGILNLSNTDIYVEQSDNTKLLSIIKDGEKIEAKDDGSYDLNNVKESIIFRIESREAVNSGSGKTANVDYAWSYGGTITESNGSFTVTPYNSDTVHYVIDAVYVDGVKQDVTDNTSSFTVDNASKSVFASFAYTVNFNDPAGGSLSVSRDGEPLKSGDIVRGGEVLEITGVPDTNYALQSLEVTGLRDDGDGKYTVTAVNGDDTPYITASFAMAKFSVKASTVSGGAINVPSGVFAAGEKVEVSFTADDGYILKNASYTYSGKTYDLAVSDGKAYIVMPGADVTVNAEFSAEDSEDIVMISTPQELITLAENVKAGDTYEGKTVILQSDLDMAGTEFIPVGYDNEERNTESQIKHPFKGVFDGSGHTVNIVIDSPMYGHQGLFGYVSGGTVKNITVTGRVNSGGVIKNGCSSAGVVAAIENGTVLNCTNNADINVLSGGGVVGGATKSDIIYCVNNGSISVNGENSAGGIVSSASTNSRIERCINNGYVWQQNEVAGGIVANASYGTEVIECINSGTVVSNNKIAGIVARTYSGVNISNCYNIGIVRQNNRNAGGQGVGGIVAYSENGIAKISNVYNAGIIDGGNKDTYTGALVGQAYRDGSVEIVKSTKAYYLGSSSDNAIGTGTLNGTADSVTADQLKKLASSLGSAYKQGALYPVLVWQDDTALDQFSAVAEYADGTVNVETAGTVFTGCLNNNDKSVDLDMRKYSDASGASVHLRSDSLKAMSVSEDIKSFSVKTDGGTLSLDSDAIDELAAAGTDVYITIRKVTESDNDIIKAAIDAGKTVYEVSFKDTSSDVWTSGKGSAVIGVPFVRSSDKTVVAESIRDTGTSEIDSSYDSADQIVTFAVNGSGYIALSEKVRSDSGKPGQDGSGNINASVWDGKSIDLTWFDKDKYDSESSYYIKTPAQLAGLAALVNGIYNKEIDTIAGDSSAIVANEADSGNDNGPNGNNKSTSKYHYGDYNFAGKTVYLTADIDMTGGNYMPIGGQYLMRKNDYDTKVDSSFCGTLDGQGHNVYIDCERRCTTGNYGDGQSVGLVGRLGAHDNDDASLRPEGASVMNLAVHGDISANRSVGGVVGKIGKTSDGGTIENCANFATVKGSDSKGLGGIVGAGWNGGVIRNCYNAGTITSTYSCPTGGISGSNEIAIENCYNVGKITAAGKDYAMAIGTNNGMAPLSVIRNCYYLDTSAASGAGYYTNNDSTDLAGHCEKKTSAQMKSADFLNLLDAGTFASDASNINDGYPVLKWQASSKANISTGSGQTTNEDKVTSEIIKADVKVSGSNASSSVKKDDVDKAVKAVGSPNAEIVIDAVSGKSGVTKSEVTVPAESVKAVAKDTKASLVVKTDAGDIKIANKDLSAITGGSGSDIIFTIEKNADGSVKVSVKSGGKEITTEKSVIRVSFKADDTLMKSLADKAGADNSNLVAAIVKADKTTEIIRDSFVNKDGTVTAYVPAGATVTVIANGKAFSDVAASAWYAKAVGFAVSHELFNGVSDTEFAPSKSMTRGMFVTVLNRLAGAEDFAGKAEFSDVDADKWYVTGTAWAAANKIVSGYGDGKFGPDDAVTREQMAVIMYNFTKAMGYDVTGSASLDKFSDSASVHNWAAEAMKWAVGSGVMSGNADGTLNPRGTATRAQVATIMMNYTKVLLGVK